MAIPKVPKKTTEKFGFIGGNLLQSILDKQPDAIVEGERAILMARRSYLTKEQIERFGLNEEKVEEQTPNIVSDSSETPKIETAKEKKAREKAEKTAAK